jgi:aspartyl-tRNA(Asn)/glutamyl-tRNA(Gln) amidotransferase subunit A
MALPEDFHFLSVVEMAERIRAREFSCVELMHGMLQRIRTVDPDLHSYIFLAVEESLRAAEKADAMLAAGEQVGPLHGIPIAVKDVINAAGMPTTANSRLLQHWVAKEDATVIARLKAAGAIITGKLNLNEFAWSIPAESDLTPPPRNPWNPAHATIGSSSGSGAAVAAGLCFGSFGTDAGGSIRLPSASCGLIGLKPTHGRISRYGVMGCRTIMDVGPMARNVVDTALLLQVAVGHDAKDPDSLGDSISDYSSALADGLRGLRLGVPWKEIEAAGVNPEMQAAFEATLQGLESLGAEIRTVKPKWLAEARAANFVALNAEEYSAHEHSLCKHPDAYGLSARTYLLQGAFLSSADYLRALRVRAIVSDELDRLLEEVEILITPTSPFLTPDAAREPSAHRRGGGAVFTAPFNLTGYPALSMPCGVSSTGLPMGVQLAGRRLEEARLLQTAARFQEHIGWNRRAAIDFVRRRQDQSVCQETSHC